MKSIRKQILMKRKIKNYIFLGVLMNQRELESGEDVKESRKFRRGFVEKQLSECERDMGVV